MLLRDRLELRPQRLVELDHVQLGDQRREPPAQRPSAAADLDHDVAGSELGKAHDRVEQVRIGEEVLPEARPHHRSALAAFASSVRSSAA